MQVNSVYIVGIVDNVQTFFTQEENRKIVRINLKVPHDLKNIEESSFTWINVTCFNCNEEINLKDWILVSGGKLNKFKYQQKDGQMKYGEQINCNEGNLVNLSILLSKQLRERPFNNEKSNNPTNPLEEAIAKFCEKKPNK